MAAMSPPIQKRSPAPRRRTQRTYGSAADARVGRDPGDGLAKGLLELEVDRVAHLGGLSSSTAIPGLVPSHDVVTVISNQSRKMSVSKSVTPGTAA